MSPDGSPKPPPEEKLLRLIREKGPKPVMAAVAGASPSAVVLARAAQPAAWPWLPVVVAGLGLLLAAEAGWVVWQVAQPSRVPEAEPLTLPVTLSSAEAPPPALEVPSLAASAGRPLFAPPPVETGGSGPAADRTPARPASQAAKELGARLSLNGIMGGESPQAIIEDTESKKTYFVTKGQAVADGAVVEEVSEAQKRVILDLNGEKIELAL